MGLTLLHENSEMRMKTDFLRQQQISIHTIKDSILQKPFTLFLETQRIHENPQGFQQNPENPHDFDSSKLSIILLNPLESLVIPRNPMNP